MNISNNLLPEQERVSGQPKVNWVKIVALISIPLVLWMTIYTVVLNRSLETMRSRLEVTQSQSRQLDVGLQLSSLQAQHQELKGTITVLSSLLSDPTRTSFPQVEELLLRLPIGAEGTWLQHVSLGPGRILLEGISLDFESVTSLGRTLTTTFGGFKVKLEEIRELTIGQQTIFRFGYSVETEG